MRKSLRISLMAIACSAQVVLAQAQPLIQTSAVLQDNPWSRGTMISGFSGMAVDSSQSGPLFGGSIGWELTRRFALDGGGEWADYGNGADAFAAAIRLRTNLAWWGGAVPFVEAGIGMYRASFSSHAGDIPDFYSRRMQGADAIGGRTFTDPSFVFGGGVNIGISRTLRLRPDVEVAVVRRDSRSHVVSGFRLHLVYVFEDHPVTPSRIR
jgi:hypothetical protein